MLYHITKETGVSLAMQLLQEDTARTNPDRPGRPRAAITEVGNLAHLGRTLVYVAPREYPYDISFDRTVSGTGDIAAPYGRTASELTQVGRPARAPDDRDLLDAELLSYRELSCGWDGYEGVAASSVAVADAMEFLNKRPEDIPLPYPQIAPDGEVGLYWHTGEVYAEVGFYGDGKFSYHACHTPVDRERGLQRSIPREIDDDACRVDAIGWPEYLLLILRNLEG